MIDKWSSKLW